jgi:hypothetical protein
VVTQNPWISNYRFSAEIVAVRTSAHRILLLCADNNDAQLKHTMPITGEPYATKIHHPLAKDQHMKRIPAMKFRLLASSAAAIFLGLSTLVPVTYASDAVVQRSGGVAYVSGGVGADSIGQLSALSKDFNLKLVFALTSGDYLSDVGVSITDASGRTLLQTTSDGPWFLIKLPAGNYQIVATFAGTALTRQAAVGATELRLVDMRWTSR